MTGTSDRGTAHEQRKRDNFGAKGGLRAVALREIQTRRERRAASKEGEVPRQGRASGDANACVIA